jgi:hypothetical protein
LREALARGGVTSEAVDLFIDNALSSDLPPTTRQDLAQLGTNALLQPVSIPEAARSSRYESQVQEKLKEDEVRPQEASKILCLSDALSSFVVSLGRRISTA